MKDSLQNWRSLTGHARAAARRLWSAIRAQPLGVAVTFLSLCGFFVIYLAFPATHWPEGDGHYTWLYTRSLVFDGDLDFRNDYKLCGDFWGVGQDRGGTGRVDNAYYIGPSIFWV